MKFLISPCLVNCLTLDISENTKLAEEEPFIVYLVYFYLKKPRLNVEIHVGSKQSSLDRDNWEARELSTGDQTCTNTQNTSIPPGVLSFKVVFVNKFNLMKNIFLLLFLPVSEGLDLTSGRYM